MTKKHFAGDQWISLTSLLMRYGSLTLKVPRIGKRHLRHGRMELRLKVYLAGVGDNAGYRIAS